ncbi:DUF3347 domain-containing protein [Flavobacterium sp.]|uniref:DUF3347 domain-containing protein n=1 Tax=Flavobacterium sp. TaxID=239 RepID=UPI002FDD13E3
MKTTFFSITTLAFGFLSFGKGQSDTYGFKPNHSIVITQTSFSTNEIVNGYLKIKNALVKSDFKGAAQFGVALSKTLDEVTTDGLSSTQNAKWQAIIQQAQKQTQIIAASAGKSDKQRKAFQELSKSMQELITTFGAGQKLYLDFCPMYEGGSVWISESKDIKNPYYGAQMLTCGKIKETFE